MQKSFQAIAPKPIVTMKRHSTAERMAACNKGLPKVAVHCHADLFVVKTTTFTRHETIV